MHCASIAGYGLCGILVGGNCQTESVMGVSLVAVDVVYQQKLIIKQGGLCE